MCIYIARGLGLTPNPNPNTNFAHLHGRCPFEVCGEIDPNAEPHDALDVPLKERLYTKKSEAKTQTLGGFSMGSYISQIN